MAALAYSGFKDCIRGAQQNPVVSLLHHVIVTAHDGILAAPEQRSAGKCSGQPRVVDKPHLAVTAPWRIELHLQRELGCVIKALKRCPAQEIETRFLCCCLPRS